VGVALKGRFFNYRKTGIRREVKHKPPATPTTGVQIQERRWDNAKMESDSLLRWMSLYRGGVRPPTIGGKV